MKAVKKNRAVLLLTGLVIILSAYFFFNKFYLQPSSAIDIVSKQPAYQLDVKAVLSLIDNEDINYIKPEEIIEVKGVIKEINYLNNRITILLGSDNNIRACVICDMQRNQEIKISSLKTQDTIKLKGVFKGFLTDAILLNCVISQ